MTSAILCPHLTSLCGAAGTELLQSELSGNTKLCGMVPQGVRFSHGFNPYNTGLGKPCPGALYPPEL